MQQEQPVGGQVRTRGASRLFNGEIESFQVDLQKDFSDFLLFLKQKKIFS